MPTAIISFDCVKSFSESRSATVTNLTVEKGFNISDNMNIEPTQFTLDGVISSYSIIDDTNEIIWDGRKFSVKNNTSSKTYNHARIKQKLIDFFKNQNQKNLKVIGRQMEKLRNARNEADYTLTTYVSPDDARLDLRLALQTVTQIEQAKKQSI